MTNKYFAALVLMKLANPSIASTFNPADYRTYGNDCLDHCRSRAQIAAGADCARLTFKNLPSKI